MMVDGCPEFLTEFKDYGSNMTPQMIAWNDMLQFYRGRNEHLVAAVKNGRATLACLILVGGAVMLGCVQLYVSLCIWLHWRSGCEALDTIPLGCGLFVRMM